MKGKYWLVLMLGFFLLGACSSPETNQAVQTAAYEGVIFHQDNAQEQDALRGFVTDYEDYRTLLDEDIPEIESQLASHMQSSYPDIAAKLEQYQRQYIGFWRQGKLYAFVNAFCDPLDIAWQSQVVMVDDGGDCYFATVYDMSEGTFSQTIVNGES
jgi:hypothetical protein